MFSPTLILPRPLTPSLTNLMFMVSDLKFDLHVHLNNCSLGCELEKIKLVSNMLFYVIFKTQSLVQTKDC